MIFNRIEPGYAVLHVVHTKSPKRTIAGFPPFRIGIDLIIGTGIFVLVEVRMQRAGLGRELAICHRGTGLRFCGVLLSRDRLRRRDPFLV